MKILVSVKRVVDFNTKVRVKADGSGIETANVKMSINPFDEIAVEQAVVMKEQGIAKEIIVVSIGEKSSEETLRHALAMGADRAFLLETEQKFEPLNIAKILQAIVAEEKPDLIIMGKQAIDDDCNQTGQMLAGLLNWPQATFASSIKINDKKATVTREIDGGLETIEVVLPAVITTDLRLNQPRYISLPNIMKAKAKPLQKKSVTELNLNLKAHTVIQKIEAPAKRTAGIKVATLEELLSELKNKEKVIA